MNMNPMTLILIARTVTIDDPPVDGTIAYVQVSSESERKAGFHVGFTAPDGFESYARDLVAGLTEDATSDYPDDPTLPHLFMPRYELVGVDGLPGVECAWLTFLLTPLSEDGMAIETVSPDWLSDDARRGMHTILGVLRTAAVMTLPEEGES
ncbi:hypothetical protein [Bifidobacterium sp. SO1]|uniref:hypothetical protein n=1 Tax=Bifidobacterium sp. SO1 TaxID=2809029 RepID=UPI001BDCF7AD|nr:hypothetical protein [Bifidobacterium sp. SO1]MBT1161706.1 hypothetical protein [Bifidobacterium sp. SO1]